MFAIVVNEKGGEQKRLEFDKPEVTIGRVQGNDIILPKGNVSKRHSRIVLKDGKFIIVDLKSTNGTYVNGRKITSPLVVKGSDKIYIGDFILSIEELQGAAVSSGEEAPAPPRPRAPTIPPPPPRPSRPAIGAATMAEEGDEEPVDDEAAGASDLPEPVRPSRPTQAPAPTVPIQAGPVARPQPVSRPPTEPVSRPPSRTDLPAMAARPLSTASRPDLPTVSPAVAPRPAPTASRTDLPAVAAAPVAAPPPPAAVAPRPPTRPTAPPAPAAAAAPPRRLSVPTDDKGRARPGELMRELGHRLAAALDLGTRGPELVPDEELWTRAHEAAQELVEQAGNELELPSGMDAESLARDLVHETLGAGPLDELLGDDEVRSIAVVRHDRIYAERGGQVALQPRRFSSPEAVERAITHLMARAGRGRDLEKARGNGLLVEARLDNGLHLTAALPPLAARGPALTVRRTRTEAIELRDLVADGLLSQAMADFLDLAVKNRRNLVVAGPAGSGRTTFLAALMRAAGESERIVSVEEAEELELGDAAPWIPLVGGRGPGLRHAMHQALRLRPERLVVGDVHGAEALDLVGAFAGGLDGVVAALQAGSAREAVQRLIALARLAPEAPSHETLAGEVARGVHLVVQLRRVEDGSLRVAEIGEVNAVDNEPAVEPVFAFRPDGGGRFAPSGHVPAWAENAPPSLFRA